MMDVEDTSFEVKWRRETRVVQYIATSGCALVGDRVYFLGSGQTCTYYSRRRKKWTSVEGYYWDQLFFPTATLVDDRIILLGGTTPWWETNSTEAIEFDIATGTFEVVPTKDSPIRVMHHSAVFAEWRREIIVFGGYRRAHDSVTNESYAFDVDRRVWKECLQKGKVPGRRSTHSAIIMGRLMYVHGGQPFADLSILTDTARLLHIADLSISHCLTWSTPLGAESSPAIGGYRYPSVSAFNGRLLVIGGNDAAAERAIFAFHPTHEEWNRIRVVKVSQKHIPPVGDQLRVAVPVHNGILCFGVTGVFTAEIS